MGTVRVGLSLCDPDGIIATPLETLPRDEKSGSDLTKVTEIVAEYEVIEVIVGNPVHLSGRVGVSATLAAEYAAKVAEQVAPVTVRLVDERLSTVTAHQQLRQAGVKGRGHRRVVDQVAAVVILQNALDFEKASGREPGQLIAAVG